MLIPLKRWEMVGGYTGVMVAVGEMTSREGGIEMNQTEYAKHIETIWDMIEEYQALARISPGYINDAADVDREGAFV